MGDNIPIDELAEAITRVMEEYNDEKVKELKKITGQAMNELVANTKEDAPVGRRRKHYRDNITSKTVMENYYGISKLWYVKGNDYRLSHLLNNGHALRDGKRYEGTNFIRINTDKITAKYILQIEELYRNG